MTTATSPRAATPAASFQSQLRSFLAAERSVESGDYTNTTNGIGGATGAYQIETSNWPTWLTQATGNPGLAKKYPYAAAAPPAIQDQVAAYQFSQYYNTFGDWAAVAGAWYAGPTNASNNSYVPPGNTLTVGQYVSKVAAAGGVPGYSGGSSSGSPLAIDASSGANPCLVKMPSLDLLVTSVGGGCLISQSQARAVVGALSLGAGGLLMVVALAGVAIVGFGRASPGLKKVAEAGGIYKLGQRSRPEKVDPETGMTPSEFDAEAARAQRRQDAYDLAKAREQGRNEGKRSYRTEAM